MAGLMHYDWPDNLRELQNVIECAVILSANGVLCPQIPERNPEAPRTSPVLPRAATLDDALHATNWVLAGPQGAAARLGMKRTTLASRMKKLGIVRGHGLQQC
jgi:formate hydrogenlyase transcriptional activator